MARHEVATVLIQIDIRDRLTIEPADSLLVSGFDADSLVRAALERHARASGTSPGWHVRLEKEIPVGAGLGGGSADAGAALALANGALADPLPRDRLLEIAGEVGSDVPFFVEPGPKLAEGHGELLTPLDLPRDFWVLVALPEGVVKLSTGDVYRRFDRLGGGAAFEERRAHLRDVLAACRCALDLGALPANDLGVAAGDAGLTDLLRAAGAFRVDVSGAGPAVYALFEQRAQAVSARASLPPRTRSWVVRPVC